MVEQIALSRPAFHWTCRHTWRQASANTLWCLLGCAIGDMATILYFQLTGPFWPAVIAPEWQTLAIMCLAICNGILTSIALETFILSRQMRIGAAFRTAIGMSLISMIAMESAMNIVDVIATGGAKLTWWVIPMMLVAGFLAAVPYNYWRLKALGKACH